MDNLLNRELKVKLDCFKNLTQMELFSNIDESMGTLSVEQARFINSYALVSGNVRGLASHASLTGRPMASRERILKLFFLKAFLNIPTTKAAEEHSRGQTSAEGTSAAHGHRDSHDSQALKGRKKQPPGAVFRRLAAHGPKQLPCTGAAPRLCSSAASPLICRCLRQHGLCGQCHNHIVAACLAQP